MKHFCGCGRLDAGHSITTIAGGTRHSASSMTAVPTVTLAPDATAATTTSATAANQTQIIFDGVMSFGMGSPCISAVLRREERALLLLLVATAPRNGLG